MAPARCGEARRAGRTDRRTHGQAGGRRRSQRQPGEPPGRDSEGPSGGCWRPAASSHPPGLLGRAARGSSRSSSRAGGAVAAEASGDASPAEVCREAGKSRRLLPSLPIGERGGSGGSAADTGREGGEAKERKGGGEKGRPGEPPAAAAPQAGWEVAAPRLRAPVRGTAARSASPHVAVPLPTEARAPAELSPAPPCPRRGEGGAQRGRHGGGGRGEPRSGYSPALQSPASASQERPAPSGESHGHWGAPWALPVPLWMAATLWPRRWT